MASHLAISFRFLDPTFHGRRDGGRPEWPPSPLRAFQSLVAAAAARHRGQAMHDAVRSTLQWLERRMPPHVVAPAAISGSSYRLSVPTNDMDVIAKAWCRLKDANPATHHTMKTIRPIWLSGGEAVHYLWHLGDSLSTEEKGHVEMLREIAANVVVLGWGRDLVIGHGSVLLDDDVRLLLGERWTPQASGTDDGLRTPVAGTLDALMLRHARFLDRLGAGSFTPPPPLSVYATVAYRRETDPPVRPIAPFVLLKPDGSSYRAFNAARQSLTVAGMMRHTTRIAAQRAGWDPMRIDSFVLGHSQSERDGQHVAVGPRRFAYLPLPSLEARGNGDRRVVGPIRRVLLTSSAQDCQEEFAWARRALSGTELVEDGAGGQSASALLSLLPRTDPMVRRYADPATSWATVTPMVLPGHDDPAHYRRRLQKPCSADEQKHLLGRIGDRVDALLRKAIVQAGFSQALAEHADLSWREVGFWPGIELARRYGVPDHLRRYPRVHVRLSWRDSSGRALEIPGPICLGGGRYYGIGLFASRPPD